jgi:hypothetical protein
LIIEYLTWRFTIYETKRNKKKHLINLDKQTIWLKKLILKWTRHALKKNQTTKYLNNNNNYYILVIGKIEQFNYS